MSLRKLALLIFIALASPRVALGECIGLSVVLPASVEASAVIFLGTAVNVSTADSEWPSGRAVTFDVDRVWKGTVSKRFVVYSFTRTLEPYVFEAGKRYLVFAHDATAQERQDLRLPASALAPIVGQCGGNTIEVGDQVAPAFISTLGDGSAPRR